MKRRRWLLLSVAVILVAGYGALFLNCGGTYRPAYTGPFHVYLTLSGDACHSITVHYQTLSSVNETNVFYDTVAHGTDTAAYPNHATGTPRTIPGLKDGRLVHSVRLEGLEDGQTYYVVVGDGQTGYREPLKFRTIPERSENLRFIESGDTQEPEQVARMLRIAAGYEPQFAVMGGDLAHCNGELRHLEKWDLWFENWSRCMVTPEGYTVPLVTAIGNHDVDDEKPPEPNERAPFYSAFFGETTYYSVTFGERAAIVVLDSDHVVPHEGAQTEWLATELQRLDDAAFLFAVYHKPFYPAHREFEGDGARAGREFWMPLFDEYGVTAAFEHHDHVFKRTKRLRNNAVDAEGVLYLGDGGLGESPRGVTSPLPWYLEKAAGVTHFWVVDAGAERVQFRAVDRDGKVFDECSIEAVKPAANAAVSAY